MKTIFLIAFVAIYFILGIRSSDAQLAVTAGGVDPVNNSTNWISSGLYAQFNGQVSGVDWNNGGARQGTDWNYGYGSGPVQATPTTQWGTGSITAVTQDSTGKGNGGNGGGSQLSIASGMVTDLNGSNLTIAEIAPEAGTFTVNGVSQAATVAGQILIWHATNASVAANVGGTITFSAVLTGTTTATATGPIGFSAGGNVYDVKTFGHATGNGTTDDSVAINATIAAAVKSPGNTVNFPAGKYLFSGVLTVQNSSNLTITGHTSADTTLLLANPNAGYLGITHSANVIVENLSVDSAKLGFSQGTITGINLAAHQLTVQVENGYPSIDQVNTLFGADYTKDDFWLFSNPLIPIFDDWDPAIVSVTVSGSSAVFTFDELPRTVFIGERWYCAPTGQGGPIAAEYNTGLTFQNFNFYGGNEFTGFLIKFNNGPITFNNVYTGPPPYQSDRLTTVRGVMFEMNDQNRGAVTFEDCTITGSWDDILDTIYYGSPVTQVSGSSNKVQVVYNVSNDYRQDDTVFLYTQTARYATAVIQSVAVGPNGSSILTLKSNVTVQNPGPSYLVDITQTNTLVLQNSTFGTLRGHVRISGPSVTVNNCTFLNMNFNPLQMGLFPTNVLIENNHFYGSNSQTINCENGINSGNNVTITGNTFDNTGPINSSPIYGIYLHGIDGVNISNNTFNQIGGSNVHLYNCNNVTLSQNVFNQPGFRNPPWGLDDAYAIYLSNINTVSLSNNEFNGASSSLRGLVYSDSTVTGATGLNQQSYLTDGMLYYLAPSYEQNFSLQPIAGGAVALEQNTNAQSQTWKALYNGLGDWELQPQQDLTQRMEVYNGNSGPGNRIEEYGANGGTAQQWFAADNGNGSLSLEPECAPGMALNLINAGTANGTLTQTQNANGSSAQSIVPEPVASGPYVINYQYGFTSAANLSLNNGANVAPSSYPPFTPTLTDPNLQLTDGGTGEARSAFYKTPVSIARFSTSFRFVLVNPQADGFTFCIQNVGATAVGTTGGAGLGYQGISNSVAVKFDIYSNSGEGTSSTGVYLNGATPTVPATNLLPKIDLHSGHVMSAWITYDGTTLNVRVADTVTGAVANQSYTVNIPSAVGGTTAYVGFTGGSGGAGVSEQITDWTYDLGGTPQSTLLLGQYLMPGQYLATPDGQYILVQQKDGNLVLYAGSDPQHEGAVQWGTGYYNGPTYSVLQNDGNFVNYTGVPVNSGSAVFSSGTYNRGVTSLKLVSSPPQIQLLSGTVVVGTIP